MFDFLDAESRENEIGELLLTGLTRMLVSEIKQTICPSNKSTGGFTNEKGNEQEGTTQHDCSDE